jgi:hypothetical protein
VDLAISVESELCLRVTQFAMADGYIPMRAASNGLGIKKENVTGWALRGRVFTGDKFDSAVTFCLLNSITELWYRYLHLRGPHANRSQGPHARFNRKIPEISWRAHIVR